MYLRRALGALLSVVFVLWGAITLAFLAVRVIPGDPVEVMLGPQAQVSDAIKASLRTELGLDLPLWQQYIAYLTSVLRLDLGESFQQRMPVVDVIGTQLGATLQLTAAALVVALLLVAIGVFLARGPWGRAVVGTAELVAASAPVFWVGLILLSVFAFGLRWLPVTGTGNPLTLILPAVTLAVPVAALLGQVLRDGIRTAEQLPFATTVRARGAGSGRLLTGHTLRHGAGGALSLGAYLVGSLLGGAVLVETVFARQGIGRVTLAAITDRDLPVVSGVILLSAVAFAIVNTAVELSAPLIDPRLRRAGAGA